MKLSFYALIGAMMLLATTGCKDKNNGTANEAGYLYTTTNGESTNMVVRFTRMNDGSLSNETAYSTNGLGGSNVAVGGDAHGDYDFQGSIKIIDDYLLNVNAGSNNVSVFSLNRTNGDLSFKNNVASNGQRPVSITTSPINGSPKQYWLVVANQWDNPNVQGAAPNIRRFPNDVFFANNLTLPDASDALRNIHLFRFDANTGNLTSVGQLDTYVRENGGPSTVTFSADGSKLAVSTWGIAHFGTPNPLLTEQHPSRVYVYDFNNGAVSNRRFFEESGISGTIGIDRAKNNNNLLYTSNFNTTAAKTNNSLTVLTVAAGSVTKTANYLTGQDTDLDEACWTVLSPSGDRLYVASFTGNVITPFSLNPTTGAVIAKLPFETRGGNAPAGDSKDVYVSSDNKYLYNTGALQSFSINVFDINSKGVKYRNQVTLKVTQASVGQLGKYNFMGLAGFDL